MKRIFQNTAVQLFNPYGPAEVTINSHAHPVTVNDVEEASVPIGVPLPNTTGYVLDACGMAVPVGVAGELYLGGPKAARGYIGRPDLTEAAFRHLVTMPDGGRLYKTGDRVRCLANGDLDFLGRVDFQIKLNGQRIEAGEIEAVLRQAEGVHDALIVLHGGGESDAPKQLVGYVLAEDASEDTLRKACEAALPRYMVPSAFVMLDAWPLNANGKIDRKQLPAPEQMVSSQFIAPRTSAEQWVADAVVEVLKMEAPSVEQDLLRVGLTSLGAVRLSFLLSHQHEVLASSVYVDHIAGAICK